MWVFWASGAACEIPQAGSYLRRACVGTNTRSVTRKNVTQKTRQEPRQKGYYNWQEISPDQIRSNQQKMKKSKGGPGMYES